MSARSRALALALVEILALVGLGFWMGMDVPADEPPSALDWFVPFATMVVWGACWIGWRGVRKPGPGPVLSRMALGAQAVALVLIGISVLILLLMAVGYVTAF